MEKLWFKRKRYGWGWVPCSMEGWLATLGFVLAIFGSSFYFRTELEKGNVEPFLIVVAFFSVALIKLCYARGEKPKWSWGE